MCARTASFRQTLGSPLERARRRGRLQLSGSSRRRSRAARLAQRWQTRRALTFRTRSKLVGRAAASGRREGWFGSHACVRRHRDSECKERPSTDLPAVTSRSDHGRPVAVVFNMLPLKVSHEKAYNGNGLYEIFIHMWYTRPAKQSYRLRCAATVRKLPTATAPASRAVVGTGVRALNARSRALPGPPGQSEAQASQSRPTDDPTRRLQQPAPLRGSRSIAALLAAAAVCRQQPMDPACQGVQQA